MNFYFLFGPLIQAFPLVIFFRSSSSFFHSQSFFFVSNDPKLISPPIVFTKPAVPSTSCPVRLPKPPLYLQDYHCYSTVSSTSSVTYPLSRVLDYGNLSSSHRALVHAISSHMEPTSFSQVVVIPEW